MPDVGQPDTLADLTCHRQCVAGEHLYRNAEIMECGDELPGVRPGRIIQRNQSDQGWTANFWTTRYGQRPITLRGRIADPRLQRLDCRGLESACFGDGLYSAFHHAQPLPILLDHGFSPPVLSVKRCEGDGRCSGKIIEDVPIFRCGEKRMVNRILIGFLRASSRRTDISFCKRVMPVVPVIRPCYRASEEMCMAGRSDGQKSPVGVPSCLLLKKFSGGTKKTGGRGSESTP